MLGMGDGTIKREKSIMLGMGDGTIKREKSIMLGMGDGTIKIARCTDDIKCIAGLVQQEIEKHGEMTIMIITRSRTRLDGTR